jgi:hypothetical protein
LAAGIVWASVIGSLCYYFCIVAIGTSTVVVAHPQQAYQQPMMGQPMQMGGQPMQMGGQPMQMGQPMAQPVMVGQPVMGSEAVRAVLACRSVWFV